MEGICRRVWLPSRAPLRAGVQHVPWGLITARWRGAVGAQGWHLFPPFSSFVLLPPCSRQTLYLHSLPFSCWKLLAWEKLSGGRIAAWLHQRDCWAPCWSKSKCSHASRRQSKQQSKAALMPHLKVVLKSLCLVSSRQQGLDCRHAVTSPCLAVLLQMHG